MPYLQLTVSWFSYIGVNLSFQVSALCIVSQPTNFMVINIFYFFLFSTTATVTSGLSTRSMYLDLDIGSPHFTHDYDELYMAVSSSFSILLLAALHATFYCFFPHLMSVPLTSYIPNFHASHSLTSPFTTTFHNVPPSLTYHSIFPKCTSLLS